MIRKWIPAWVCSSLIVALPVQAGDAMRAAIATLPEDAMAFVCVPSLKQLDDGFQQTVNNLGLQAFLPPPTNSIVGMIKQHMPMLAGIDPAGPLAVVLMPTDNLFLLKQSVALIVSTQDPKGMITSLGGQPGEEGAWSINLFGEQVFAATGQNRIVVAPTAELAKKVASSKGGLDRKIQPEMLKTLEGLDKAIWIDAKALLNLAKDQINGMVGMITMMQAASGPLGAKQGEATKKQVDMLVEGTSSLCFGVSLKKPGLAFRIGIAAKPGSELAQQIKVVPTKASLLRGLPADQFLLALGQIAEPAQVRASIKNMDPYLEMLDTVEGLDKERVGQLQNLLREWLPMATGLHLSVRSIGPGPDGLFALSVILDTSSSKQWLGLAAKAVEISKKLITDANAEWIDDDVKMVVDAIAYDAEGESIGGVKVSHLKFDLSKIDALDEDDLEQVLKVIGKEGILFRLAGVDAQHVVVGFGGGAESMGRLIKSAGSDAAGLADDPGIKKVRAHLTGERASEIYLSVDRIVNMISRVAKVLDEEEFPVKMPSIDAPLGISSTGGTEWNRVDVFIPTELMVAVKNAILGMMMGGGQPMPQSPSTSAAPAPGGP